VSTVLDLVIRFVVGGLVVSAFAVLGDVLHPKSFAGIFGAAPSVALATLTLTFVVHGGSVVSVEGRSMIVGAAALCLYSLAVAGLLSRWLDALPAAAASLLLWFGAAFAVWGVVLR
jgi:hypothetical protein